MTAQRPVAGTIFERFGDFFEWNARAQLTTWYPTLAPSYLGSGLSPKCNDYARKQWAGLVAGYYAARAALSIEQAERVDTAQVGPPRLGVMPVGGPRRGRDSALGPPLPVQTRTPPSPSMTSTFSPS